MLERIKQVVKSLLQKTGAETRLAHDFKNIFEIGGVPAFNQFYYFGIFPWKYIYRGFYKPWHRLRAPRFRTPAASETWSAWTRPRLPVLSWPA